MTFNIDTDIDLNISKLDELLNKLKLAEDRSRAIRLITIKEFAKIRGCSIRYIAKNFCKSYIS